MQLVVKRNGQLVLLTVDSDLEVTETLFSGGTSEMNQVNAKAPSLLLKTLATYGYAARAEALRKEGNIVTVLPNGIEINKASVLSQKINAFLLGVSNNPSYVPVEPLAGLATEIRTTLAKLGETGSCPNCVKNDLLRQYRARVAEALTANGLV